MSSTKKSKIKLKKSKKMSKLDNWINAISTTIANLLDGTFRQCHNDTLNSYVVKTKVKSLKSKLKMLLDLKKQKSKTPKQIKNNEMGKDEELKIESQN